MKIEIDLDEKEIELLEERIKLIGISIVSGIADELNIPISDRIAMKAAKAIRESAYCRHADIDRNP